MAILGKGPGPKKNNKNKVSTSKVGTRAGQTVAAPGYGMGLIRNEKAMKEPTKKYTMGSGPAAVTRTQQQGIIGPKPLGPGGKAGAATPAPKKKRTGRTAVGQALYNTKDAITDVTYELRKYGFKNPFQGSGGGRRRRGKTCPAY
jgi:hypothetical protein